MGKKTQPSKGCISHLKCSWICILGCFLPKKLNVMPLFWGDPVHRAMETQFKYKTAFCTSGSPFDPVPGEEVSAGFCSHCGQDMKG